jgi:hypothetical protein
MDNFYCAVCYMQSLLMGKDPIRMQGRMVIDGQSVCEVHAEAVLRNVGGSLNSLVRRLNK